jgi:hypothetical protein
LWIIKNFGDQASGIAESEREISSDQAVILSQLYRISYSLGCRTSVFRTDGEEWGTPISA